MKAPLPHAICLGAVIGFLGCCLLGRVAEKKSAFEDFSRIHPFLEQETSYFPTASQLAATARAQCPPGTDKTLVILGGNSVFNGSGQKRSELWSRILQEELGDQYHVINFSAPGAGVVDNGGVVFEMLFRDYPRMVLVTNTEPGYYAAQYGSSYSYLFWDAYCKGLLIDDRDRETRLALDDSRDLLSYRLNSRLYFNDLWTGFSYQYASTVWSSWLKERSFHARRRLPDWYDKRKVVLPSEERFQELLPGHIAALRGRKSLDPARYKRESDGRWSQTPESLREEAGQIAALLPDPLKPKTLVVFTPLNPWFLDRLAPDERDCVEVSFSAGVKLLESGGFRALSLLDQGFEPFDFGDTVHLSPAGGRRLARSLAPAIRDLIRTDGVSPAP